MTTPIPVAGFGLERNGHPEWNYINCFIVNIMDFIKLPDQLTFYFSS